MKDKRRRHIAAAVVLALTLGAIATLPFRNFDSRIDVMLPDRSELRGLFTFLNEIEVADKVVVTIGRRDGGSAPELLADAADRFTAALDPELARPLHISFKAADLAALLHDLLAAVIKV